MLVSPGDIAFKIGPLPIYYYGIIMATSLCLGVFVASLITKKIYPGLPLDIIYDISPHIIIGSIIGARLYYCLLSYDYYSQNLLEILEIRHGGLSIHGALIGGLLAGMIYAKKHKLPILKLCDIFSYGLALGQAVGRWGNFFNSEAFGLPCNNCFIKLFIPIYKRPLEYLQYNYFHPTFLYESILDVCIFLILFLFVRKIVKGKDGVIFFSYLILYSIARIIVEQIRIDSVLNVDGIPIAQIVSAITIIISIIALVYIIKTRKINNIE